MNWFNGKIETNQHHQAKQLGNEKPQPNNEINKHMSKNWIRFHKHLLVSYSVASGPGGIAQALTAYPPKYDSNKQIRSTRMLNWVC